LTARLLAPLASLLVAACPSPKSDAPPDAKPDAEARGPERADARRAEPVPPPALTQGCRAIAASGGVQLDAGAEVPLHAFIDLGKGARLATKQARTGRELGFEGPGRVQPCHAGLEEVWVERGIVTSSPGSGEAPGQEAWVVTPLGVVRYAAAALKVDVTGAVEVWVQAGAAFAWMADDARTADAGASDDAWIRLGTGATLQVAPKAPKIEAAGAATQCAARARVAADLGRAVAQADAGALGDLGPRHLVARKAARAACAVAGLRAAGLAREDERAALERRIAAAEADFKGAER
jgi:hypothetical protein